MRPTRRPLTWALLATVVVGGVVAIVALRHLPPHLQAAQEAPVEPAPLTVQEPRVGPGGPSGWTDPSVDPELLARAFAPPRADLPPEALPQPSAIIPPQSAVQRLERQDAITY